MISQSGVEIQFYGHGHMVQIYGLTIDHILTNSNGNVIITYSQEKGLLHKIILYDWGEEIQLGWKFRLRLVISIKNYGRIRISSREKY